MATSPVLGSALYPSIFNPLNGEFLTGGTFSFFGQDKQTPKNVYDDPQKTNPRSVVTIGSIGAEPPLYYDTDEPYWVEIRPMAEPGCACDEADPIYTFYFYPNDGGRSLAETNVENLFPSYGFDSRVFPEIYNDQTLPSGFNYVSFGWAWENVTTNSSEVNTYEFIPLNNSGYIGNPKNELVLKSTGNSSGNTVNRLRVVIGFYNDFQGETLALSLRTRLISGSVSSLPVKLFRTKNRAEQPDITVGALPIAPTAQQQLISFTVPALADDDYQNEDTLNLCIELPQDQDFQAGFTGSWLQESTDGSVQISECAVQIDGAKQLFGGGMTSLQAEDPSYYYGYPVVVSDGSASFAANTGEIFLAPSNTKTFYQFCVDMNSGKYFLADQVYQSCPTNRIISFLKNTSHPEFNRSVNTFVSPSKTATTLVLSTGLATAPALDWQSFGTNITLTKTVDEFGMGVKAVLFRNSESLITGVNFQWIANGAVTSGIWNYETDSGVHLFDGGTVENGLSPILANYCGYVFDVSLSPGSAATQATFNKIQSVSYTQGTATTPASFTLFFPPTDIYADITPSQGIHSDPYSARNSLLYKNTYLKSVAYEVVLPGGNGAYPVNYLAWQNGGDSVSPDGTTIQNVYTNILGFSVEGSSTSDVPAVASGGERRIVNIYSYWTAAEICNAIATTINNAFEYTITFAGVPASGSADKIYISTGDIEFVVIPWNITTTPAKPENPDLDKTPIYVQFETGVTIPDLITAYETTILSSIAGMPYPQDVGLPVVAGLNHYMHL